MQGFQNFYSYLSIFMKRLKIVHGMLGIPGEIASSKYLVMGAWIDAKGENE